MNKLIAIAGLLALSVTLAFAQKKMTPDEVEKAMEKKGAVFFLDVREPDEIQKLGTMPGYVNIPLAQLESRMKEIPKNKPIVTACSHGTRAGRAAAILEKNGFQVIGACGMEEWKEKGKKVIYPEADKKKG
ncbi:MAG: rhodanese-like domain-containing protein [Bryobacteraceae bacterium]